MDRANINNILLSAILVILGIILSGPPLVFLVEYLKPQPSWVDTDTFVSNFHRLQTLPYWFGFLLLAGNILFIASVSRLPAVKGKIHSSISIICVVIYGSLVSFNYSIQATAIPALVSESNSALETFSMVNPSSICWTIEMFAYAILGIAFWLTSVAFQGGGIFKVIKYLMIFNGVSSVLGILIPVIEPEILLESSGIAGYVFWNLLVVSIMVLVIIAFRRKISLGEYEQQ
jgi:hypothetical protein